MKLALSYMLGLPGHVEAQLSLWIMIKAMCLKKLRNTQVKFTTKI